MNFITDSIILLLTGRSVLLEQPRKSGSKVISHMLSSHGGEIFLHVLSSSRSILEDPPSISEGCGGRVTDYRITVSLSYKFHILNLSACSYWVPVVFQELWKKKKFERSLLFVILSRQISCSACLKDLCVTHLLCYIFAVYQEVYWHTRILREGKFIWTNILSGI